VPSSQPSSEARLDFAPVAGEIEAAIAAGAFPGAVIRVSRRGGLLWHEAFGARSVEPERTPMRRETIFDLSSLTKPLATTTAFLLLCAERKVQLDDRVSRFFPNFGVHGKTQVSFRHLLAHCSGLAAWRPFHRDIVRLEKGGQRLNFVSSRGAKEWVYEQIHRERPEYPPGSRSLYSDLGFMLLGELVELLTREPLDRFCAGRIWRPLGLRATAFIDLTRLRSRQLVPVADAIAPTERCPWRKRILCGEVHDDNAFAMGGVAGHAGLFASAAEVDALAARLLACWRGEDDFLPTALLREAWSRDGSVPDSTWALGWDMPAAAASTAGRLVGAHAVGHLGFTGTSLWIDLDRQVAVTLLTNRVHPSRENDRIRDWRPRIHDAVWTVVGA
jgi:CubicO group peptidase (beta-lactamase class C family)